MQIDAWVLNLNISECDLEFTFRALLYLVEKPPESFFFIDSLIFLEDIVVISRNIFSLDA